MNILAADLSCFLVFSVIVPVLHSPGRSLETLAVKSTKAIHMVMFAVEKCPRCSRDIKGSSFSSVAWISVSFPRENRSAVRSKTSVENIFQMHLCE